MCKHSEINNLVGTYLFSKVIKCLEQTFENKSIAKDHGVQSKLTEYKIFVLKHANRDITREG